MRGGREGRQKANVPVTAAATSAKLAEEGKGEEAAVAEDVETREGEEEELQSSIIIRYAQEMDSRLKYPISLRPYFCKICSVSAMQPSTSACSPVSVCCYSTLAELFAALQHLLLRRGFKIRSGIIQFLFPSLQTL